MVYCQTIKSESIAVHPMNDVNNLDFVEMVRYGNEPQFAVFVNDGEDEWVWEFDMACPSDYERVKMSIFDVIFECDTMLEVANMLDEVFTDGFEPILVNNQNACIDCDECRQYDNDNE